MGEDLPLGVGEAAVTAKYKGLRVASLVWASDHNLLN